MLAPYVAAFDDEHERLPLRAYQALRRAIRDLRLTPGQMVLEKEAAAALGISRTPVREALVRLEAEGLYTPLTVTRTEVANHNDLLDKLTVAFVSGSGPDLTSIGSGAISQMAHPGFLLPLDSYSSIKSAVADFFESGRRIGTYKGKLYGLTYVVDMRLASYRKDYLAEAGIRADRASLPKTWEQFRDVGPVLTRHS